MGRKEKGGVDFAGMVRKGKVGREGERKRESKCKWKEREKRERG